MVCKHERLGFQSGGFFIACKDCHKFWVAVDRAHCSDQALDPTRGGDGLTFDDERIAAHGGAR